MTIYNDILTAIKNSKKLLAVLIDPDKMKPENVSHFFKKVNTSITTHIFVGGSEVKDQVTDTLIFEIKKHTNLPIVLFPGDVTQITEKADAILFLSLISGRNVDYLISKHVASASKLIHTDLEVIPTGYILIENGKETAVQRVTNTKPMSRSSIDGVVHTAFAGQLLGKKIIYLEAGSGAKHPVPLQMISKVKHVLNTPLIVGGGIKSKQQLDNAYKAGADLVVIGTAFEEDVNFFNELVK